MVNLLEDLRLLDTLSLEKQLARLEELYGEVSKELLIREIRDVIEESVIELTNSGLKKISYELLHVDEEGILLAPCDLTIHAYNETAFSMHDEGHTGGYEEYKQPETLKKEKAILDYVNDKLYNEKLASRYLAGFYELDFDDFQL